MNPEEYASLFQLGENHWWFVGTRDILFFSAYRSALSGGAILDVGCGSGLMMKRFMEIGSVFGIDSSDAALAHCRTLGFSRLSQADATMLPFKSDSFELIIAADLLEHCEDDNAVLRELYRVTKSHGMLLTSVPAHQALWSAHDTALHHKRRYSKRELLEKVRSIGYAVERASYFNTLLFPPLALARLTLGKFKKHASEYRINYYENFRLLNRILLGVMRAERCLITRFDLPFGLSILLLASKE